MKLFKSLTSIGGFIIGYLWSERGGGSPRSLLILMSYISIAALLFGMGSCTIPLGSSNKVITPSTDTIPCIILVTVKLNAQGNYDAFHIEGYKVRNLMGHHFINHRGKYIDPKVYAIWDHMEYDWRQHDWRQFSNDYIIPPPVFRKLN